MRVPPPRSTRLAAWIGLSVLAACGTDPSTAPDAGQGPASLSLADDKVGICHLVASEPRELSVGAAAVGAHLGHGDYVTTLEVDPGTTQAGDGIHFTTIGGAYAAARAGRLARGELTSAACRIVVSVAAGTIVGTHEAPAPAGQELWPIIVDVPDISFRGALVMGLDANGRATGAGVGGIETVLQPAVPLPFTGGVSTPIFAANAHPGGSAGHGFEVTGFVFRSGNDPAGAGGGQGVMSARAERMVIRGNRFEGGFTESVDLRGGSAALEQNHFAGTAGTCDMCLAGPGRFRAEGNRMLAGGIPGIAVSPIVGLPNPAGIEPTVLPAAAEAWAEIVNNEVSDHQRVPVGVGIRFDAVGVLAPNVAGTTHAVVRNNRLVDNRFGIILHAAFPNAAGLRRGDLDVAISDNSYVNTCQARLLVSFARHTTTLGLTNNPWLLNSTFRIALENDVAWADAWHGHPDGFGNVLEVDGQVIGNGVVQGYDAGGCPGA